MRNHVILFLLANFLIISNSLFAQPPNDDCTNAIPITVGTSQSTAVPISGTTVNATGSTVPVSVCSVFWSADDVWYSFTTDSTPPANGVTVKVIPSSLGLLGMAVYTDCDTNATPLSCFSESGSLDSMNILFLQANTTYYVRMWSGGGATTNSGIFDIIVYENVVNQNTINDVVLWTENFSDSINGWTSNAVMTGDDWIWEADATSNGAYSNNTITSPTALNGAMLFDADFMTTSGSPGGPATIPPYPQHTADLLSPIIDCSNMPSLAVKFYQSYHALNGNCYFSYSIDGGQTFSTPININSDIAPNTTTPTPSVKRYHLPNASGSSQVQLKFTADMDFYNWIIDDVQLVEIEKNNLALIEDFIAVAPNYSMPYVSLDTIRFLANVANIGVNDATNVVLSVNVVSDISGDTVFSATNYYGTILSGDTIKNQPFSTSFLPALWLNEYTATYILSSDSTDVLPFDNVYSFPFEVKHFVFRKAPPFISGTMPYSPVNTNAFSFGTTFYATDTVNLCHRATAVGFSVASSSNLTGEIVELLIEKPVTGNQFLIENNGKILQSNRTIVAKGTYVFTGNEMANSIIPVPIADVNTTGFYYLEPDMNYSVVLKKLPTTANTDFNLNVSRNINYSATEVAASLSGSQRLSVLLDEGNTGDYDTDSVSKNIIPILEVYYEECLVSTKTQQLNPNTLSVFPNPADEFITASIALEIMAKKATLTIYNINGQIMETRNLSNITKENVLFDLENYESGTYFISIETEKGHSIKRFVVTK